mgnify:CR=1 FL=1
MISHIVKEALLVNISVFQAFSTVFKTYQDHTAQSNGEQISKYFHTEEA